MDARTNRYPCTAIEVWSCHIFRCLVGMMHFSIFLCSLSDLPACGTLSSQRQYFICCCVSVAKYLSEFSRIIPFIFMF